MVPYMIAPSLIAPSLTSWAARSFLRLPLTAHIRRHSLFICSRPRLSQAGGGPLRRSAAGCDRGALSGVQLDRAEGTGHRQRRCAHRRCARRSRRLRSPHWRRPAARPRRPPVSPQQTDAARAPHSHPADSGYGTLMDRGGEGCDRGRACDRCSVRRSVGALPAPVRGIGSVLRGAHACGWDAPLLRFDALAY